MRAQLTLFTLAQVHTFTPGNFPVQPQYDLLATGAVRVRGLAEGHPSSANEKRAFFTSPPDHTFTIIRREFVEQWQ